MNHEQTAMSGKVVDVFAHRFVVQTAVGTVLADLGPRGAERVSLQVGDDVELWGEMKPSELKVARIAKTGAEPVSIEHGKLGDKGREADWAAVVRTVEANGLAVVGEPRRKPKHFEILGRDKAGAFVEMHIEIDGRLLRSRPASGRDLNWAPVTRTVDG